MEWVKTELPTTWRKLCVGAYDAKYIMIDTAGPKRQCGYMGTRETTFDVYVRHRQDWYKCSQKLTAGELRHTVVDA